MLARAGSWTRAIVTVEMDARQATLMQFSIRLGDGVDDYYNTVCREPTGTAEGILVGASAYRRARACVCGHVL